MNYTVYEIKNGYEIISTKTFNREVDMMVYAKTLNTANKVNIFWGKNLLKGREPFETRFKTHDGTKY